MIASLSSLQIEDLRAKVSLSSSFRRDPASEFRYSRNLTLIGRICFVQQHQDKIEPVNPPRHTRIEKQPFHQVHLSKCRHDDEIKRNEISFKVSHVILDHSSLSSSDEHFLSFNHWSLVKNFQLTSSKSSYLSSIS